MKRGYGWSEWSFAAAVKLASFNEGSGVVYERQTETKMFFGG